MSLRRDNREMTVCPTRRRSVYTNFGACWHTALGTKELAVTLFLPYLSVSTQRPPAGGGTAQTHDTKPASTGPCT